MDRCSKPSGFISHKVFVKSFCRSQVPHNSVNLSFTNSNIKVELTDLCGIDFFKNDFKNALCKISVAVVLCTEELLSVSTCLALRRAQRIECEVSEAEEARAACAQGFLALQEIKANRLASPRFAPRVVGNLALSHTVWSRQYGETGSQFPCCLVDKHVKVDSMSTFGVKPISQPECGRATGVPRS
jgi:hypothetical protein